MIFLVGWVSVAVASAGEVAFEDHLLVDILDVGQGDAIVLRAAGKTVLIDAGDRDAPTVEHLRMLRVTQIDLAVGTHPHADHIGRMDEVIENFPVLRYMHNGLRHTTQTYLEVAQAADTHDVQSIVATTGMTLSLGDAVLVTVLNPSDTPLKGTRSDLNSNSVVLRVDHGEVSFLFTGDAEAPTEQAMLRRGIEPVDVLKIAHHGSNHSTTAGFLRATQPSIAVISCGEGNRYDHPGEETVQRLTDSGIWTLRTDLSGHIRLVSDGTEVEAFEGDLAKMGPTWPLGPLPQSASPVAIDTGVVAASTPVTDAVVSTGRISSGLMSQEPEVLTKAEQKRRAREAKRQERERLKAEKRAKELIEGR